MASVVKIAEAFVEFVGKKSPLMKVIDDIKEKATKGAELAGLKGSKKASAAWVAQGQKAKNAAVASAAAAKASGAVTETALAGTAAAATEAGTAAAGAGAVIGGPVTLALAACAAVGFTLYKSLGQITEAASDLKEFEVLAKTTGQSAAELTALSYALDQAGSDLGAYLSLRDSWNASVLDIQFGAGKAGAALRILGVRATDEAGNLRELRDVLPEINRQMERFNTNDQRRLAGAIFGGGADSYMRSLKGPTSLNDSANNARELGLVSNDATVRAGAQLSDAWGTMLDEFKALWRNFAAAVSPILTPAIAAITVLLAGVNKTLSVFNALVVQPFTWIFSKVHDLFTWMNRQADGIAKRFSWIKSIRDFFLGSTDAAENATDKLGRGQLSSISEGGYRAELTGLAEYARSMIQTAAGRSNVGERQYAELQKHTALLGTIAGSPAGAPTFGP